MKGLRTKNTSNWQLSYSAPPLFTKLSSGQLRIFVKKGEGGCKNVVKMVHAWILSGNKNNAIALFDKDSAGVNAKHELCNSQIFQNQKNSSHVSANFLQPSAAIKYLYTKKINLPYEIEHLLSTKCWASLIQKKLVKKRDYNELSQISEKFAKSDVAIEDTLEGIVDDKDVLNTIVLYEPKDSNAKKEIKDFVAKEDPKLMAEYMDGFKETVILLEQFFCKNNNLV